MVGYTPPCPVHAGIHAPLPSACWDTHTPLPSACWDTPTHPCPVHAGMRSTSGRTHPTGMHTCVMAKAQEQDLARRTCGLVYLQVLFLQTANQLTFKVKQECIPVGGVPSAPVVMSIAACTGQGGVYPRMYWAGGVCPAGCPPGGYLPRGSLPGGLPSGVGVGVSSQGVWGMGDVWLGGGLVCPGEWCIPACTMADIPPPVDRILDTCLWKYYLAATLFNLMT